MALTSQPSDTPATVEQIRAGFDAAAPGYDTTGTFFTQIATRLIEQAGLTAGDQILDAGCGTGQLTIQAARVVGPAGRVSGIDLSDQMLRRAEAYCAVLEPHNVTLTRGDAHEPPYRAGSFDAVIASMLVFLLTKPEQAVQAWYQRLRPGGRLAFSWNAAEDPRWQPIIAAVDAYVPGDDGFETLLHHPPFGSVAAVEAMLEAANFTDINTSTATIESRYTGPRHWWAASWSQAPRIAWERIPHNRHAAARADAFRLLEELRNPNGTLTRRSRIAFTMTRRPNGGDRAPDFTGGGRRAVS